MKYSYLLQQGKASLPGASHSCPLEDLEHISRYSRNLSGEDSQPVGTVSTGLTKYSRVSKMTYSFRSLYHDHCVIPRFIPQVQTCLARAQLPSSHFVIKEKILWLAEAQGLVLWPCLCNQESGQGIMQ